MIFYHYCSVETFKNIISSKVLWLSDLTKSNGDEEVIRTFQILWKSVRLRLLDSDLDPKIVTQEIEVLDRQFDIEILLDAPYGCCFCMSGDVLQQWQEYGERTKGVVLGFDFDWFSGLQKQMPHPNSNISHAIGYSSVIYSNKDLEGSLGVRYNKRHRKLSEHINLIKIEFAYSLPCSADRLTHFAACA